ncbi:SpoIIE family protein phosphatase [Pseudonocardia hydrocarbonoxydans]|uniref:STAS domain-containing protein n=1 Tax=Pseudonocardia hydrocarbonoxydans TaxID=76726 RepID=A0A4Y3WTZ3_9PSEU|nr:SpoIIE family protein phosphatase [Pseudonocardia hydrocarbonoxydans]GEC22367.1 hypothetical protein PHY01_46500 [Pseudonocardia hydrocarbonoxydans]
MRDDEDAVRRRVGDADAMRRRWDTFPAMLVAYEGPQHRVVTANAAYRTLLGRPEPIGSTLRELLPELDGQQIIALVDRVYTTGTSQVAREWRVLLDRTGTGELQARFIDFVLSAFYDGDGRIAGVNAYGVDVTEQVHRRQAAQTATAQAQAATAEAQRRYERARDLVGELQRELLPSGVPVLPGVQVAASYLLADVDTAAGGDWFDAQPLPDGRVALVVGDVVGHGVTASAVMGQLRAVLAERLADGTDLTGAMAALDRSTERIRGARAATVGAAVLDPRGGALEYCTAGHPPPLVVPAAGEARYLPPTGAGPLGTGAGFPTATATLDVGDGLLLYTDGILERPGRTPAESTVELAQVVTAVGAGHALGTDGAPVERWTTQTLELMVRATGHTDDITLLAAQRIEPVPPLEMVTAGEVTAIRDVRSALGTWLQDLGAAVDDAFVVQHAVGEVVTNAVEHAYSDTPREVSVRARLHPDGALGVVVADRGRWRPDPGGTRRGIGLGMTRDLVDAVHIDRGADGTTVGLTHRLFRPARLLTTHDFGAAPTPRDAPEFGLAGDGDRLVVTGPVDAAGASELHRALRQGSRGGTRALTVDLTAVTHLASAGVAVLHANPDLTLVAPAGSVAQQVLALVALPHLTGDPAH